MGRTSSPAGCWPPASRGKSAIGCPALSFSAGISVSRRRTARRSTATPMPRSTGASATAGRVTLNASATGAQRPITSRPSCPPR
jgi:hypothetical protein